ncbi:MAG: hypothetical protein IJD43_03980, partial [Thermoguttaceae bacterium]|nr:hypothetical protein [Thermoguttaceae bacterium]
CKTAKTAKPRKPQRPQNHETSKREKVSLFPIQELAVPHRSAFISISRVPFLICGFSIFLWF